VDVVERLTLEAAQADTVLACEHRHRYEFAAGLCAARRVLDLCCGSGYGSAILAAHARQVVGVDNDAGTIDTAQATLGRELTNTSFEAADALAYLHGDIAARFDVVVCFEGLEHLHDLDAALRLLREHAQRGVRIVASVPNGKLFGEQNPFHVTEFGYDEAIAAFAPFPATVMVPQFLAEGSLICPPRALETDVTVSLEDRDEPEYANHFLFCVNFEPAEVERVHHGRINVNTAPIFNRWSEDLKHANRALRRENARLARARLGKAGSAAASALAGLADREAQVAALQERCRIAEARVLELEAAPSGADAPPETPPAPPRPVREVVVVEAPPPQSAETAPAAADTDEDPNSWEHRRRRAADVLIPWVEQSISLAGKTVLEYGCGNAAVSCAFAERAGRLIGVDIDPEWIELGNEKVRERGLDNVQLELHSLETILDAVAARRGEIDVFLLYAVLEHLTVAERLAVLQLAREVVKPDGAIVVCETPNRLIYFDHHTAQMPFFHLLPDELAVDYYRRSARDDFRSAIDAAAEKGRGAALEAIIRWGRGVSFHEFELVFGDLSRHVIASNYDPILFPERPVHPEEVILSRYLDRMRPDLAPVWSRYWLDLILSPEPVAKRPPFLRPWTADTTESRKVGWTRWESLHLPGPQATLWVTLPHPTTRLVVGTVATVHQITVALRSETTAAPALAAVSAPPQTTAYTSFALPVPAQRIAVSAPPQTTAYTSFALPVPAQRIAVSVSHESRIVFVGYED
jgi:2-polyprenyl-3-methyl-5-hydroxy-6-metoxy-1,4-benzoquinol methylase